MCFDEFRLNSNLPQLKVMIAVVQKDTFKITNYTLVQTHFSEMIKQSKQQLALP